MGTSDSFQTLHSSPIARPKLQLTMDSLSDFLQRVPQSVQWALAGVGTLALSAKLWSYVSLLLNVFVLSGTSLRKYGKPGTWAVITGASDGMGKEYANQG